MLIRNFGWDVSTAVIGMCCLDASGEAQLIEHIRLFDVDGGLTAKYHVAAVGITDFIDRSRRACPGTGERHFIEERLLNKEGRTTRQVVAMLAAINAVATHVIIEACQGDHTSVTHLHPSRVKRLVGLQVPKGGDKKAAAIALARTRCASFPYALNRGGVNPVRGTDDMADAYITALAGYTLDRADKGAEDGPVAKVPRRPRDRASRPT